METTNGVGQERHTGRDTSLQNWQAGTLSFKLRRDDLEGHALLLLPVYVLCSYTLDKERPQRLGFIGVLTSISSPHSFKLQKIGLM